MAIITPLKKIFKWQQASEKIPYRVYTALLTQTGTNAPVAKVLENTIGDITWSYLGIGGYGATINDGKFDPDKFVCIMGNPTWDGSQGFQFLTGVDTTSVPPNLFVIGINEITTSTPFNGILINTPIEIRIYN